MVKSKYRLKNSKTEYDFHSEPKYQELALMDGQPST